MGWGWEGHHQGRAELPSLMAWFLQRIALPREYIPRQRDENEHWADSAQLEEKSLLVEDRQAGSVRTAQLQKGWHRHSEEEEVGTSPCRAQLPLPHHLEMNGSKMNGPLGQ